MRSVRRGILRTLAITAFTGMTIGGSLGLSRADSGLDTGAGGTGYQEVPGNIQEDSGSGAGGSTDSGTSTDPGSSYRRGSGVDSGTGYGTGGSVETGAGGTSGSGTGGVVINPSDQSDNNKSDSGTVQGGVFYPDYSKELGAGKNAGPDDNR
jgi:hypothetical protein